jgi:hypothetical protein
MSKREREDEGGASEAEVAQDEDADWELLGACARGNVEEVKTALWKGASLHALDDRGRTGLMKACNRTGVPAVPVVQLLLRDKSLVARVRRQGAKCPALREQ